MNGGGATLSRNPPSWLKLVSVGIAPKVSSIVFAVVANEDAVAEISSFVVHSVLGSHCRQATQRKSRS